MSSSYLAASSMLHSLGHVLDLFSFSFLKCYLFIFKCLFERQRGSEGGGRGEEGEEGEKGERQNPKQAPFSARSPMWVSIS